MSARACVNVCVAAPPPCLQGSRSQKPTGTINQQDTHPHTDTRIHIPSSGRPRAAPNVSTCMCECVCSSTPPRCTGEQELEANRHHTSTTYTPTYRYTYSHTVLRASTGRTERNVSTCMRECVCSSTPPGVQGSMSQKPTGTMRQRHTRPHTDRHTHLPSSGRPRAAPKEMPARACVNACVAAPAPGVQGSRSQKPTGTMNQQDTRPHTDRRIHIPPSGRPQVAPKEMPARACVNACVAAPPPSVQGSMSQKPTVTMIQQHTRPNTDTHTHLPSSGHPQVALNISMCMCGGVFSSTLSLCTG